MGLMPPWIRLVPWVAALSMALALWAMSEREARLSDKVTTEQAATQREAIRADSAEASVESLQRQILVADTALTERERVLSRFLTRLTGVERAITTVARSRDDSDCSNQSVDPDIDRVLAVPIAPGTASPADLPGYPLERAGTAGD